MIAVLTAGQGTERLVHVHASCSSSCHTWGHEPEPRFLARTPAQLLACIGEQFTEGDEICGIVVNVRAKQDKLCVWTKTASNEAAQVRRC